MMTDDDLMMILGFGVRQTDSRTDGLTTLVVKSLSRLKRHVPNIPKLIEIIPKCFNKFQNSQSVSFQCLEAGKKTGGSFEYLLYLVPCDNTNINVKPPFFLKVQLQPLPLESERNYLINNILSISVSYKQYFTV